MTDVGTGVGATSEEGTTIEAHITNLASKILAPITTEVEEITGTIGTIEIIGEVVEAGRISTEEDVAVGVASRGAVTGITGIADTTEADLATGVGRTAGAGIAIRWGLQKKRTRIRKRSTSTWMTVKT